MEVNPTSGPIANFNPGQEQTRYRPVNTSSIITKDGNSSSNIIFYLKGILYFFIILILCFVIKSVYNFFATSPTAAGLVKVLGSGYQLLDNTIVTCSDKQCSQYEKEDDCNNDPGSQCGWSETGDKCKNISGESDKPNTAKCWFGILKIVGILAAFVSVYLGGKYISARIAQAGQPKTLEDYLRITNKEYAATVKEIAKSVKESMAELSESMNMNAAEAQLRSTAAAYEKLINKMQEHIDSLEETSKIKAKEAAAEWLEAVKEAVKDAKIEAEERGVSEETTREITDPIESRALK